METKTYRPISRSPTFLRVLHNIEVNKEKETCSYTKLGVRKEISGEKYGRLEDLVFRNSIAEPDNRMAMVMRNNHTGKKYVVIDRAFYGEF
jgi:hypothetical protein